MPRQHRSLVVCAALVFGLALPTDASAQSGAPDVAVGEEAATPSATSDALAPAHEHGITEIGSTGLYRTHEAGTMRAGSIGLSLGLEFLSKSDVVRSGDENDRVESHFGVTWAFHELGEAFVEIRGRGNTNSFGDPELIQSLGDTTLGAKGFYEAIPGVSIGGLVALRLLTGADSVGYDLAATSADILALGTFDLRELADAPVRVHLNTGYLLDNSAELFDFALARVERFAHDVYDYDRFRVALGLDVPLPWVNPYAEWVIDIPIGAPCSNTIDQVCLADEGFAAFPSLLTLGLRGEVYDGLVLHGGIDLGVTTVESQGTPAVPAWNLLAGVAYQFRPGGTEVIREVVEVPVEVPVEVASVAALSHVTGEVVDSETGEPVSGAIVRYLETDYTPQITGDDGRFRTFDFEPGADVTIEIEHPEYHTEAMRVVVTEEVQHGVIQLEPAIEGSRLSGRVTSSDGGPLAATILVRGDDEQQWETTTDASGEFELDVDTGEHLVFVTSDGHLPFIEKVIAQPGRETLNYNLEPGEQSDIARVTPTEIELPGARRQPAFDESGALLESYHPVLDAIVAILERYPDLEIQLRAHTDDRTDPEVELEITEESGRLVFEYFVEQGISPHRVRYEGAGATEPRFPNISERNRSWNRRLEVLVRSP